MLVVPDFHSCEEIETAIKISKSFCYGNCIFKAAIQFKAPLYDLYESEESIEYLGKNKQDNYRKYFYRFILLKTFSTQYSFNN